MKIFAHIKGMKKKLVSVILIFILIILPACAICQTILVNVCHISNSPQQTSAIDGQVNDSYIVYTEENEYLFEKSNVEEGDLILTKDFKQYEIVRLDKSKRIAYAKFIKDVKKPNISKKSGRSNQFAYSKDKNISMYLTHNDESYKPTDGYDSIYGAGGIHDVANKFKRELEKKGANVTLDETLHIPHNSSAYTRSGVTAKKLNEKKPDALFDIHRDGVARSYYLTHVNGKEASKVRIVVGKSNPNFQENYDFATIVFAVGQEMYPWLFSDIYCGKGHYNQALQNKALLFEMGTYLIEKDLVFTSMPYLADVVDTVLYGTTVEEEPPKDAEVINPPTGNPGSNNIVIGGDLSKNPTVNEHFDNLAKQNNKTYLIWLIPLLLTVVGGGGALAIIYIYSKNNTKTKEKAKKNS